MKVLITVPKLYSAIGRLARQIQDYNHHHQIQVVEVHPKRPDQQQLDRFLDGYEWCDIWDAEYWKTAEMLRERYGERLDVKPSILSHYNPYDLCQKDWKKYNKNIVCNLTQKKVLKNAQHIPLAVDMDYFTWNDDYTERETVLMVAQRIEGSKGIEPIARACKELGYNFILVGQISDQNYFMEILKHGNVTFMENINDYELRDIYKQAAIHVCNSKDNFESGTLPILEAMASGVPVLTRNVGHVPDLYNEKNMMLIEGQPDDYEEIKAKLHSLMDDRQKRLEIREAAWDTVRNYNAARRARQYSTLYYKTFFKNPLVSVIIPVYGHTESLEKQLAALDDQTYPAIEVIVVSNGDKDFERVTMNSKHALKYFNVGDADRYGLGLARDYGVMEAEGEIIVFLDQRFVPEPNMVEEFVKNLKPKKWLFGNKNGKRNFVENVSCIYRQEFIDMGMSNQLINGYGGMSQELRERSKRQGIKHIYIENAKATAQYSSHNKTKRRQEIRQMKEILWNLGLY